MFLLVCLKGFGRDFNANASLYVNGEIAHLPAPQAVPPPPPQVVPPLTLQDLQEEVWDTEAGLQQAEDRVGYTTIIVGNPVEFVPYVPGTIPLVSRSQSKRPATGDAVASGSKQKRARSSSPAVTSNILISEVMPCLVGLLLEILFILSCFSPFLSFRWPSSSPSGRRGCGGNGCLLGSSVSIFCLLFLVSFALFVSFGLLFFLCKS